MLDKVLTVMMMNDLFERAQEFELYMVKYLAMSHSSLSFFSPSKKYESGLVAFALKMFGPM